MKLLHTLLWVLLTVSACQTKSTTTTATSDGTVCFVEALGQDSTFVKLQLSGNTVTGDMHWQPYQKDGAVGTLQGKRSGDTLVLNYNYVIEGSQQIEEKIMVLSGQQLLILSGELQDLNGRLSLKNPAQATVASTLSRVDCSKSDQ